MNSKEFLAAQESYPSRGGHTFRVIKFNNSRNVRIEFIATGYQTTVQAGNAIRGTVMDKLAPSVWGLGYIGAGKYKAKIKNKNTPAYEAWNGIFKRCYSLKYQEKKPTYAGCSVDPVWFNFQTFAEWYYASYFAGCQVDKDILVEDNKVYGPTTCLLVTQAENIEKASAKSYVLLSPEGQKTEVYNLRKFCLELNINPNNIYGLFTGKRKSCHGWRAYNGA